VTGKPSRRRERPPEQPRPDPWQIWFSRLIQVMGLAVVVYETRWEHNDRPWLLLVAVAMMTGGLGLQVLVRWLMERMPS
jgi:hypothetical protein